MTLNTFVWFILIVQTLTVMFTFSLMNKISISSSEQRYAKMSYQESFLVILLSVSFPTLWIWFGISQHDWRVIAIGILPIISWAGNKMAKRNDLPGDVKR